MFKTLRLNKFIECSNSPSSTPCHSCALGKQMKLSFMDSHSLTFVPFDIFHSDPLEIPYFEYFWPLILYALLR